jgi:anti-anti-sigma factor
VTAQQTYRIGHVDLNVRPFRYDATVTAAYNDGAAVFAVRSWTEPGPTETGPAGPVAVVAADGEIDVDTAPLLAHALGQALDRGGTVCCDLSQVTFFGAAAANLLLAMHRRATETRQLFFVRGAVAMTEHVLVVVDPCRVIPRY